MDNKEQEIGMNFQLNPYRATIIAFLAGAYFLWRWAQKNEIL